MILALDTSGGELLACTLSDAGELIDGVTRPGRRHQEEIIEVLEELVGGREGVTQLSAIAVVRGPGSQTGLRVGLSTAAGLAFARHLELVPLSSLAVAAQRLVVEGPVFAAVSAGRSKFYVQRFTAVGSHREPVDGRALLSAEAFNGHRGDTPVGAEPAVLQVLGHPAGVARPGVAALAQAVAQALGENLGVAYHQLTGDY